MQRSWVDSPLYTWSDWAMRMAYLNIIWLLFTAIGLFLFGFMPATVALFTLVRKQLLKQDVPVFKTFFSIYKRVFIRSNLVGLLLALFGYVLLVNFTYLGTLTGTEFTLLRFGLVFVSLFYVATLLFIFPVLVHFQLPIMRSFKQCILVAFINPHIAVFMGAGVVAAYYLFKLIPGLTLFFCGSVIASFLMWATLTACKRIEKKQQLLLDSTPSSSH